MSLTTIEKQITDHFLTDPAVLDAQFAQTVHTFDGHDIYVFAIGDLEGNIEFLYRFFFGQRFLRIKDGKFVWAARPTVYVIQLGDQLDRNKLHQQDTDLAVPMFMDFLFTLSNGHVISIAGNHEYLNFKMQYYEHVSESNCSVRKYIGHPILQSMFKRRYIAFNIKNVVFSHAGIKKLEDVSDYNTKFWKRNYARYENDILQALQHRDFKESTTKDAKVINVIGHNRKIDFLMSTPRNPLEPVIITDQFTGVPAGSVIWTDVNNSQYFGDGSPGCNRDTKCMKVCQLFFGKDNTLPHVRVRKIELYAEMPRQNFFLSLLANLPKSYSAPTHTPVCNRRTRHVGR